MNRRALFLATAHLLLLCAYAVAQAPAKAPPAGAVFRVQFQAGEKVAYAFDVRISVRSRGNPRLDLKDPLPALSRSYRLTGGVRIVFSPGSPELPLHAQMRFHDLAVSEFRADPNSGTAEGLTAFLKNLEGEDVSADLDAQGGVARLSKLAVESQHENDFTLDLDRVKALATSMLHDDGDRDVRSLGTEWDKTTSPPRYVLAESPGMKATDQSHIRYLRNLDVGGRSLGLLAVTGESKGEQPPDPAMAAKIKAAGATGKAQLDASGESATLFDLAAHREVYARFRLRVRVRFVVRSADTDAAVRIPVWLYELDGGEEGMVRLVSDDAAFDSQLLAAQPGADAVLPPSPPRRDSLGNP